LVRKRAEFPSDEAAALEKSFRVKTLSVHADMALDRFRRLSQKFDLTFVSPPKFPGRTWVYELSSRNVEAAFLKKRKSVNRWAWRAVGRDLKMSPKDGVLVKRYLNGRPFRAFQVLNQLMKGAGVASVLASSPINLQEMTGIPFDRIKSDLLSLYTGRKIYLLSPRPVMGMRGRKSFSTLREAVEALAGKGTLGVEEKNLDIGRSLALGLSRLKNASNMFRAWREVRSGQDLAAYILGSLGTKYAMEGALEWTANRMKDRKPVFEKEVQKAFYRLLKEYEKKEKTPLRLEPYFMVLHAGVRTPYPSLPGIFRLSAKMKSLKLDAGIVVKDRGLILACSDLARSITTDKKGEDLYRLMEKAMLEGAIPGGRQGRTGEDVYWAGMRPLLKEERRLRAWKLLPRGGSLKRDYNRDIGHTFGKQESTTLFFKKGENVQKLKEGMVSAIEYQWPYQGYALGIEDMFVVGPKYGINITR
jgi:Xaa-Pro aminopeptidase